MGLHAWLNGGASKLVGYAVALVAIAAIGEGELVAATILGLAALVSHPSLPPIRGHPGSLRRYVGRGVFFVLFVVGLSFIAPV